MCIDRNVLAMNAGKLTAASSTKASFFTRMMYIRRRLIGDPYRCLHHGLAQRSIAN